MPYDDERRFLHDFASPLSVAHGNLKIALRKIDGIEPLDPQMNEILERLNKAMEACEKMAKQLSERRQSLMDKEEQVAS